VKIAISGTGIESDPYSRTGNQRIIYHRGIGIAVHPIPTPCPNVVGDKAIPKGRYGIRIGITKRHVLVAPRADVVGYQNIFPMSTSASSFGANGDVPVVPLGIANDNVVVYSQMIITTVVAARVDAVTWKAVNGVVVKLGVTSAIVSLPSVGMLPFSIG
jgi:hypothetical protein